MIVKVTTGLLIFFLQHAVLRLSAAGAGRSDLSSDGCADGDQVGALSQRQKRQRQLGASRRAGGDGRCRLDRLHLLGAHRGLLARRFSGVCADFEPGAL